MTSSKCGNLSFVLGNCTNSTSTPDTQGTSVIIIIFQVINITGLIIIMAGMGCTIALQDIIPHLKRPWGLMIGFTSQYLVMPLTGFSLAHAFSLKPEYAIGVLVISCCPGGVLSNIFTYWTDGDVVLSVMMTSASTLLALGMMPLTLFIYSRSWTSQSAAIPYVNIIQSLAAILIPVFIGIWIRHKWKRVAEVLLKVCGVVSLLIIIAFLVMLPFINPAMFQAPWSIYFIAFVMPVIGGGMGYLLGSIFRLSFPRRRAIAFETGLQNVPLASTVVSLTFESKMLGEYLMYPIVYGPTMIIDSILVVLVYLMWKRYFAANDEENDKLEITSVNHLKEIGTSFDTAF